MITPVVRNGKNYVFASDLHTWEINDQIHTAAYADMERLKRQLDQLGQYKNLLILEDGTIIGGNNRFRGMRALAEEGDSRFNEVWVSVLSFQEIPATEEQGVTYRAVIDGEPQKKTADTEQQIKLEYMTSDNDEVARWERDGLARVMQPYKEIMPMADYKINLGYPTDVKTFLDEYNPGPIDYGEESEDEKKADEMKYVVAKFSPDQFETIEPVIQDFKDNFGIKNNTDMVTRLLEFWLNTKGIIEKTAGLENNQNTLEVDQETEDKALEDFGKTDESVEVINIQAEPVTMDEINNEGFDTTATPISSTPESPQPDGSTEDTNTDPAV
jgi:hypothetical protein